MEPIFPRINNAIRYSLEYYEIGRIKDYMLHFGWHPGKISHPSHLTGWNEFIFKLHEQMENEINQTIFTTNVDTKVYLFETMKAWLDDYRVVEVNHQLIELAIERYNTKTYAEFEVRVDAEVEKFRQSPGFTRPHLEEYEVKLQWGGLLGSGLLGGIQAVPQMRKEINYKYYCIKESPELIDTDLIPLYLELITPIILNFRTIFSKYVARYDAGKIVPLGHLAGSKSPEQEPPFLEEPPKGLSKLKLNLSVPQLTYLFKMLHELKPDIFDVKVKMDLYRFISDNFVTKGSDDISVNKVKNLFNDTEKEVANFWVAYLQKMLQNARKV